MQEIKKIVEQYLQGLAQRDLDQLVDLYAEKVDWEIPGNIHKAAWLGKRSTKAEIREFFLTLWKNIEPISAHVERILYDDNFAVILGKFASKMLPSSNIVDSHFCIQIGIDKGKIVWYRLYEDSFAVSEAL